MRDKSVLTKATRSGSIAGNTGAENIFGTYNVDDYYFFSSRRRHTISLCDWSSDVCSSDLTLTFRSGIAPSDVTLLHPSSSSDLVLSINGTADKVTLQKDRKSVV